MNYISYIQEWVTTEYGQLDLKYQLIWLVFLIMLIFLLFMIIITITVSAYQDYRTKSKIKLRGTLKPLIVEFLFDDNTNRDTHLNELKKWLSSHSSNRYSKGVFKKMLLEFHRKLKGDSSEIIEWVYAELEFDLIALKKFNSVTSTKKEDLIREMSQMKVLSIRTSLEPLLFHKNPKLRLEAQIAMVNLFGFEGLNFLNKIAFEVSDWAQLIFLEKLSNSNSASIVNPLEWLNSKNNSIVSFGLKYIQRFYITNHLKELIKLIKHPNDTIVINAVETIQFLEYKEALNDILNLLEHPNILVQLAALNCIKKIGDSSSVPILENSLNNMNSKMLKVKTLQAITTLVPDYRLEKIDVNRLIKKYKWNFRQSPYSNYVY